MTPPLDSVHENPADNDAFPVLRSQTIRSNADGLVCLNDIWSVAGSPAHRRPAIWRRTALAQRLAGALANRIVRNSHNSPAADLIRATRGNQGVTFAHIVLAQAYAEFLDDDLAVEVREVFLRYRAGDANLADEILEKASAEENRRVAARALGRATRGKFTDVLKGHGVVAPYYAICTDTMYQTVLGAPAAGLKQQLGVQKGGNLRDRMSLTELAAVALAEAFSADTIDAHECHGGPACKEATAGASRIVRVALDAQARTKRNAPPKPANDHSAEDAA